MNVLKTLRSKWWGEYMIVMILLALACILRVYAAAHAGVEVDEPIYRYAAAYAAQHGFPAVRAAYQQRLIPFLYHPPFFLWLLAGWFALWHSTSYFTARMLSVLCSTIMLVLLYMFTRNVLGRVAALLALFLVASDVWIIFTNQAVYLENSQMVFIILAMWAYWRATQTPFIQRRQYLIGYVVAGLLIGWVLVYKQIGGYLLVGVVMSMLLQKKGNRHRDGHLLLGTVAAMMFVCYLIGMHTAFGSLFDQATLTQVRRTFWERSSAGLTYSPITALQAVVGRYYIFPTTIVTLVGGSVFVVWRCVQHLRGRRQERHPALLGWAAGSIVFALSISLKSPHYMILWLVPIYIIIAKELAPLRLFPGWSRQGKRQRMYWGIALEILFALNLWSYQARFVNLPGDTLAQADAYINAHIPASAVVVTQDYIGVDIDPSYVNINFITNVQQLDTSRASYAALYWSTTEPLSPELAHISSYCVPMHTFSGFKDTIEVCKIK